MGTCTIQLTLMRKFLRPLIRNITGWNQRDFVFAVPDADNGSYQTYTISFEDFVDAGMAEAINRRLM